MAPVDRKSQLALQEDIIRLGEAAYDPALSDESRNAGITEFKSFLERTSAFTLLPALTGLIQPERVKPWLRPYIVFELSSLALRPKGVRNIIEFVLSVHPTSKIESPQSKEAASKGPSISMEALSLASEVISNPPIIPEAQDRMPSDQWFGAVAPQLFSLLDGQGGLEMVKVASYVIGYGILGRKQYGAPGSPGWKAIVEPILGHIDPSLGWEQRPSKVNEEVVTIRAQNVLVSSTELATALRRLTSLLSSHPNPNLSRRLLRRLLLPLWSLASWPAKGDELEDYRAPSGYLLNILLQLSSSASLFILIADNLMYNGSQAVGSIRWRYSEVSSGGIQIEKAFFKESTPFFETSQVSQILDQKPIDYKVNAFMDVLKLARDDESNGIPELFLTLCERWLLDDDEVQHHDLLTLESKHVRSFEEKIIDVKIMQGMIEAVPNKLVGESGQVLELANNILDKASRSDDIDIDDTVSIALSLLNMVLTSPSFKASSITPEFATSIINSLRRIASTESETSTTAQNLLMLLEFKLIEPDADDVPPPQVSDKILEDRRTYKLAMGYITSPDSPPPVRAQGLDLLTSLISDNSPILDVPAISILISSLLQDEEEYIYLRAIKAFIQLSIKHPRSVMNSILERYFDANEELPLDARLRLGEALLQVIEKAGQTFTGETAHHVGEGLLALAGRRGYRPKTETERKKRLAVQSHKNKEAEQAWEGPVPQLEDIPEDAEEDALLNQIVEGWEGKRSEEDVRIRASALSIFGTAIETNIAGMGSAVVAGGVDLSINILPLEPEPEKAILRRAAVLLVLSLIRALDKAKEEGKNLGFGFAGQSLEDVTRIFKYISDTDNDGLVRQHAKDVLEELENWKMKGLLGPSGEVQTELSGLRGLSIGTQGISTRPKIEEIE